MIDSAGNPFSFCLEASDGPDGARAGRLTTPHGSIDTPVFMPVGTHSTVKMLTWEQVASTGAQIVLANAYHLTLRPGFQLIERAGGLHQWMNWHRPILTDSGGFQVFSLAHLRKISEEGVRFKDPLTGHSHFIGPKESMAIQNALGADIIMAFDDCPPYPSTYENSQQSLARTHRWLETCFECHARPDDQALFPIVQGSVYEDLRLQSVKFVSQFPVKGVAIGGVSVGEEKSWVKKVVAYTTPLLPTHVPRYLMGVGTPEDLLESIRRGVDMFDCVMPTRIARHGSFFTPYGRKIIKNAEFTEDFSPLVEGCPCYACTHHHRAYIRHLYKQSEPTASVLLSIHNIYTLVQLAKDARQAIIEKRFLDFYALRMEKLGLPVQ